MKHFFLFLFGCLVCASCTQTQPPPPMVNTISNANSTANIQRVADKRVQMDAVFSQILVCTEIRESKTNDGYKRIQVFLKNCSTGVASCNYRFTWFDENGVSIPSPDNEMWKRLNVIPGDDAILTSIAPKRDCGDFQFRIIGAY